MSLAFAASIVAVYALSLGGGFLNYDDDWLIRDNPLLQRAGGGVLRAIWFDLGAHTRQSLGAEYLPVRDTLVWLEVRLFGLSPHALRAVSLILYLAAAFLVRAYLRRTLLDPRVADLAAWLFALHPVHAESVAWLAGQKDLVALLLVAGALVLYAGERPRWRWAVPLLLLAAMFGKAVAVAAPLLLPLHDFVARRRPRWGVVGAALAASVLAIAVHVNVGRVVGMMAAWSGGSRLTALATMGPVGVRYLLHSFIPVGLAVHQDVPIRSFADVTVWAAFAVLLALVLAAVWAARRGERLWAWALGWFVAALLPTSQVLAPLQNVMADRYLLLAVLGPCVVVAVLVARVGRWPLTAGVLLIAGVSTLDRALTFRDSVSLFEDATRKAPLWAAGWYQLGRAATESGPPAEAEAAFRRALALRQTDEDAGRRAANSLSALLAAQGRLAEARAVLRDNVASHPDDPRALNNLAEITARLGEAAEARRLYDELRARFPGYTPGERNFNRRYGAPPAPTSPAPAGSPPPPGP